MSDTGGTVSHSCEQRLDGWACSAISVLVSEIHHAQCRADVDRIMSAIRTIRRMHQNGLWEARHFDGTNQEGASACSPEVEPTPMGDI
jgi:hypothetical protein